MDPQLQAAIERLARDGAARFSHWKPALFQEYCRATLPRLVPASADPPGPQATWHPVANAFAEVLQEGVGRGHVVTGLDAPPANLMEYCLRDWLVRRLADAPGEQRLQLLADAWNLLEGLLREPRWVNAYVLARVRELEDESSLQAFLGRVLQPLFEPATRANWGGPFRVTTLSLRAGDDDFLPGDMHLVAPNILAVKDRRRDVSLGVVLRKQGRSELLGIIAGANPYAEPPAEAAPRWQGETFALGSENIPMKFLAEPFRWVQTQAGFVVASAVNSQKVWIAESAT
jgi:hypothetical protein